MPTGLEKIRALRETDRKALRKRIWIMIVVVIVLWLAMSCMRTTAIGFISPIQAFSNLFTAARLGIADLFNWDIANQSASIIADHPYYYETLGNFRATFIALIMGAVLAMAGAVYQNVFRNPIATPSMLGISSGVNIANLILVVVYSASAVEMVQLRFALGFAIALVSLIIIFLLAKLMGGKKSSVTDMLLIGTIVMRLIGNFINIYEYYIMDDTDYLTLEELNNYGSNLYEGDALLLIFGVLIVSVIVIILIRFSLNAISFTDEESKSLGINPDRLRFIALIFGTLMVTAVQINYGDIGMMALLVPHLCRKWFGCDFRFVLLGSAGVGAIVMILCRLINYLLSFDQYLSLISMGTIINIVTLPIIFIILISQRKTWNQQ